MDSHQHSIPIFKNFSLHVEDLDDLSGKRRFRAPKRRRKFRFSERKEALFKIHGFFRRWWPVLVLLTIIATVLFSFPRISKPEEELKTRSETHELVKSAGRSPNELKRINLNRLDMLTRRSNGSREPCLKLLSSRKIQGLEFPMNTIANSPVKRVLYKTGSGSGAASGNNSVLMYPDTRFNLFTGNQTFHEREESFKVKDTTVVHCGFYCENGGFRISDEDKSYMQTCKAVVSTCAFGGGDDLYQPIGMLEESLSKVCYVAFWDETTLLTQESEGGGPGADHMIGKWRIVVVRDLPFVDQRLNGKIPKMLSHRLFPRARYSIWVDSKSQFRRDPMGVLEALLWRTNLTFAISEHGARSNIYEEGVAIIKKHKASPKEVDRQLTQYARDGFPDDRRFRGKRALSEASIIVREHTPLTNLFMCVWFNEMVRFTSRDQLSFPYVLRRLNVLKANIFPVCTRKDMVNSMGHTRKVKPLMS